MIEKIIGGAIFALTLVLSLAFHEYCHAYAAYRNGDSTAKDYGRLTLNPMVHLDPIGTLLPLILYLSGASILFGWAKPVPVNYGNLNEKRKGVFWVSIAGVLGNLFLAFLASTIIKILLIGSINNIFIINTLTRVIQFNIFLFVFNLLPIPPLDGSKLVWSIANQELRDLLHSIERYGNMLIMILVFTGAIFPIINFFFSPIYKMFLFYINHIG